MIVFDLLCSNDHRFEGWFASSADHEAQAARGLIACPLCDDHAIARAVTAAAVPAKSNQRSAAIADPAAKLLAMQRALEADSTWVGDRFASEARALHARGADGSIHGTASLADARALLEDGVPLLPLPFRPKALADA